MSQVKTPKSLAVPQSPIKPNSRIWYNPKFPFRGIKVLVLGVSEITGSPHLWGLHYRLLTCPNGRSLLSR